MNSKKHPHYSFFSYGVDILFDIILGIVLGVFINVIMDYISRILNLPFYATIIIQVFLIICVLYIMKVDSRYLYSTWRGANNYGILFTTSFIATQGNIVKFFEKIWNTENNTFGVDLLTSPYKTVKNQA